MNDRQRVIDTLNRLFKDRALTALEFSLITQYFDYLEGQVEGYSRALKRAQNQDDKYWLEVRTDPESRRSRLELFGYTRAVDAKAAADVYLSMNKNVAVWICAADIEIPYPTGVIYVDQLIKKEETK